MKQLNHFDRILDYAEGRMDDGQRAAFEAELSVNEGLREEYDAFRASQKALEVLAFEELGNMQGEVEKEGRAVPIWQRAWARAAAVLLLMGVGLFWYANGQYGNRSLADAYFMTPNVSSNRE